MKSSTIKKVWNYMKNYRMLLIISFVFATINVVLSLYIPILIGAAIDQIVGKGKVDFVKIREALLLSVLLACMVALAQWIMSTIHNKVAFQMIRDIRVEAFSKIQGLPLKYIDQQAYGDIMSRVVADVDQLADGLLMGFAQFFTGIMTILTTLIFMFRIHWNIAVVVMVLTPISLLVARFISNKTYHMFSLQSELKGEQTAFIDEIIGNEKVVKAYTHEDESMEKFDEINNRLAEYSLRATFYSSLTNPCTRFVNSIVYAGVGLAGALISISGGITVGALSCFLSYANQYTKPFNEISGVITELQNSLACAERVFAFMEEPAETETTKHAIELGEVDGAVCLEDVSFSYVPEQELIKNFNLSVKPGQRIAIVGPTGCGKTTLINLLMRFYDINSGKITIDGNDIKNVTRESLRKNYGMVLQETWLKAGTIRENLIMGKTDATEEQMLQASKAAFSHSFIKRLPNGYDTYIGEGGEGLSQGQKQLLCIARVMLCLPPMLILDEATSSIDTRTELKIQDAFGKMMKGRTSFIVAHRLSTIREADVILVMKDGNIIEQGNHKELLQHKGFYEKLYNSQFVEEM